ncbi:hypothetical protein [Saccharopolyspora gregorii]|uniref:Ferredoxin n=1 Tax=Saccharopolyspora gregorii TaxID=33914 RepID=A0ABP6RLC1_9PSEU|nr:hypothetical protein [Saccharopolyspora gregorii]
MEITIEENGVVVLLDSTPPPEVHETGRAAAAGCPAAAIRARG